jgi:ribose transport system ATP-binding protein
MLICDRIAVMSAGRIVETFERGAWSQDAILSAAFSGYLGGNDSDANKSATPNDNAASAA